MGDVNLQEIIRLNGDTFSSAEVLAAVKRAATEIERLRTLVLDACEVFDELGGVGKAEFPLPGPVLP